MSVSLTALGGRAGSYGRSLTVPSKATEVRSRVTASARATMAGACSTLAARNAAWSASGVKLLLVAGERPFCSAWE